MGTTKNKQLKEMFESCRKNWNKFARDILNVHLDNEQQKILEAVQHHHRVSVRSGNARGKDFVAAVAALCFLFLNVPSKVIMTAPTERQAQKIMMTEIRKIYKNARIPLGGEIFENQIKFIHRSDWFLIAFKAVDYKDEVWTGFHAPYLMVVVTEASGIEQQTFNNIESILTGNSKLLIVFNPNRTTGEAYNSAKSQLYQKFQLSCLDAPNVIARKTIIPGQVDYDWVAEKVYKWCTSIDAPVVHDAMNEQNDMKIAGLINNILSANEKAYAMIDAIGQGAGVYSRLSELEMKVTSAKFSESPRLGNSKQELTDFTGQRNFVNMRAYCHWAIREALDPQHDGNLALPPLDELTQDLTELRWTMRSDGRILIEEKSEIKKRLGRSPDYSDALALSYYPIAPEVLYPFEPYIKASPPREWGDCPNLLIDRSFLRMYGR